MFKSLFLFTLEVGINIINVLLKIGGKGQGFGGQVPPGVSKGKGKAQVANQGNRGWNNSRQVNADGTIQQRGGAAVIPQRQGAPRTGGFGAYQAAGGKGRSSGFGSSTGAVSWRR